MVKQFTRKIGGMTKKKKKLPAGSLFFDKFNSIIGDNKQLLSVCKDMNIM